MAITHVQVILVFWDILRSASQNSFLVLKVTILQEDAETFESWGVDYVKLDGCYSHPNDMDKGYPEFGYWLNQTGRPMIYACSWPVYQTYSGMTVKL